MSIDFFLQLGHEVGLQLILFRMFRQGFDTQLLNFSLTFGTLLPTAFRTFVTADMNIFGREDIHNFIQYIFGELKCLVITCTEYIGEDTE